MKDSVPFLLEKEPMNKSSEKKNRYKYVWVDDVTPAKKRTTGSGVTFRGHYERVKRNE